VKKKESKDKNNFSEKDLNYKSKKEEEILLKI